VFGLDGMLGSMPPVLVDAVFEEDNSEEADMLVLGCLEEDAL
jgi:hypothetical protein